MSFRSDVSVDWTLSPRKIQITGTSAEITVQELYDTLRTLAASFTALDDAEIVDAGGKEGGIVAVTMTLKNAHVAFNDTGTARLCRVTGGNLFAVDESGTDICPISYVPNITVAYAQSTAPALIQAIEEWTTAEKAQVLSDVAFMKQVDRGRWKIQGTQLIMYDVSGTGILRTFNLYDAQGNLTSQNPFERIPVE